MLPDFEPCRHSRIHWRKNPSVVVWQVGPADAIQDSGVEIFQEALRQGIGAVQAAGADVVLIDLPYGPEPYRYKALREYQNAIVATAREMNIGLISIYSRMARHFSGTKVRTPHECTATWWQTTSCEVSAMSSGTADRGVV